MGWQGDIMGTQRVGDPRRGVGRCQCDPVVAIGGQGDIMGWQGDNGGDRVILWGGRVVIGVPG